VLVDDTTQIEQPDTPAPLFAVRAFKTALFGTPAPRDRERERERAANDKTAQSKYNPPSQNDRSPVKPPGILLTPGTGTTRRKRVSFGRDVKEGAADQATSSEEEPGKLPIPRVPRDGDSELSRPKTRLTEVMEQSRTNKASPAGTDARDFAPGARETDDAWEEVEEDYDSEDDNTEVTVDLNEPHSRSGKYWKSYFESYHADAKLEMEKLVKYKQLAKSYAKKKDAEAMDLNEKLKEEQEKVKAMEQKVAELGRHVALRARNSGGNYDPGLVEELTKQTALALDYKKQVEELESLLRHGDKEPEDRYTPGRRIASPRTQKTLLETQRELRRARSQIQELDKLREERDKLRSELRFAEERASKLAAENRKIASESIQSASKVQDLEKRLTDKSHEALMKDNELKKLRADYNELKANSKKRYQEALEVLQKKNSKISELQDELGALRMQEVESKWAARAKVLENKLKSGAEKIEDPDREDTLKFLETAEKESTELLNNLQELRRVSVQKGLIAPTPSTRTTSGDRQRISKKNSLENQRKSSYDDKNNDALSSRTLRERIDTDLGKKSSKSSLGGVLSDRANLQDSSRSSLSSVDNRGQQQHKPGKEDRDDAIVLSWPEKPSRPLSTGSTRAGKPETKKATIDDIFQRKTLRTGSSSDRPTTSHQSERDQPKEEQQQQQQQQRTRKLRTVRSRPLSRNLSTAAAAERAEEPVKVDLVQDSFAPLGGAGSASIARPPTPTYDISAAWSVMNATRAKMSPERRAAAIARIQRKRAERVGSQQGQGVGVGVGVDRNKENVRP